MKAEKQAGRSLPQAVAGEEGPDSEGKGDG